VHFPDELYIIYINTHLRHTIVRRYYLITKLVL
jgi:hypothetical protein